ncbi:phage tail tube protein [Azospirillum sp. ST 5-10]|uniref:phage tail tube protein n=1 Tax=unclassified Azospirillum TaxID=2630922 RepID=UPI003F49EFE9
MAVTTAAGTSISIGTAAGSPSGDTYTLIGEVTSIGEFGKEFQEITHQPLDTRETQKFKGSFNAGTITLSLGGDLQDAGQEALAQALDSDELYNFRVEYPDKATPSGHGSYRVFQARVMSYKEGVSGTNDIVKATATLSIQGAITRVAAT